MQALMRMGAESHETGRLPGEDEMSNKTSVISPAGGPPTHGSKDKRVEEEMANPGSTTTANPNLAETREVVIKYINEHRNYRKVFGFGTKIEIIGSETTAAGCPTSPLPWPKTKD
jgi:hypothetical protein